MRNVFKIIKEHFVLLLGTGLFTYGLFDFSSGVYTGIRFSLPLDDRVHPVATYYYYNKTSLILLTIGAVFIVIGLLKIRKKKGEN